MLKSKNKSKEIDESQLSHIRYNRLYHIVFIGLKQLFNIWIINFIFSVILFIKNIYIY